MSYVPSTNYNNYTFDESLYVNTDYNKLLAGDNLKIDIVGTSSIDIILDICRKRSNAQYSNTDIVVDTATATLDTAGVYSTFWQAPNNAITGDNFHYYPRVKLGINQANNTVRLGETIVLYDRLQSIIAHLDNALGDIQSIPVYDELSKDSINGGTEFRFTYKQWNKDFPVLAILNGSIYNSINIDYDGGKIYTGTTLTSTDELYASYTFKFFENLDLRMFIERSISEINMISPVTSYNYSSFPDYWYDTVIMNATLRALDSLFASALFREKQVIFGDKDVVTSLNAYYSRLMSATDAAKTKIKKMHDVHPAAISGLDVMAPPRTTGSNFRTYAMLRGKAI